jgi:hypothetical protein
MNHSSALVATMVGFRIKKHLDYFYEEHPEIELKVKELVTIYNFEIREKVRALIPRSMVDDFTNKALLRELQDKKMRREQKILMNQFEASQPMRSRIPSNSVFVSYGNPLNFGNTDLSTISSREVIDLSDDNVIASSVVNEPQPECDPMKIQNEQLLCEKSRMEQEYDVERRKLNEEIKMLKEENDCLKAKVLEESNRARDYQTQLIELTKKYDKVVSMKDRFKLKYEAMLKKFEQAMRILNTSQ